MTQEEAKAHLVACGIPEAALTKQGLQSLAVLLYAVGPVSVAPISGHAPTPDPMDEETKELLAVKPPAEEGAQAP